MPTEITVRGSHVAFQAPERGTAQVTLGLEGPQVQPVYEQVVRRLEAVKSSVEELHDPEHGPVTWWSTNLVPLCRRHHRAKTHSAWRYDVIEPSTYLWTSPTGRRFLVDPTGTRTSSGFEARKLAPQPPDP